MLIGRELYLQYVRSPRGAVVPPPCRQGGAGSGRAEPVPRRLLGVGRWRVRRSRLGSQSSIRCQ